MNAAETQVSLQDCSEELHRLFKIRHADLTTAVNSRGSNRMTKQAAHFQLAKLRGAILFLEELRTAGGPAALITRRPRMVKTVL